MNLFFLVNITIVAIIFFIILLINYLWVVNLFSSHSLYLSGRFISLLSCFSLALLKLKFSRGFNVLKQRLRSTFVSLVRLVTECHLLASDVAGGGSDADKMLFVAVVVGTVLAIGAFFFPDSLKIKPKTEFELLKEKENFDILMKIIRKQNTVGMFPNEQFLFDWGNIRRPRTYFDQPPRGLEPYDNLPFKPVIDELRQPMINVIKAGAKNHHMLTLYGTNTFPCSMEPRTFSHIYTGWAESIYISDASMIQFWERSGLLLRPIEGFNYHVDYDVVDQMLRSSENQQMEFTIIHHFEPESRWWGFDPNMTEEERQRNAQIRYLIEQSHADAEEAAAYFQAEKQAQLQKAAEEAAAELRAYAEEQLREKVIKDMDSRVHMVFHDRAVDIDFGMSVEEFAERLFG